MQVQGFLAPGHESVAEAFAANLAESGELGASFCVMRDGETLIDIWAGFSDKARTVPWAHDTIVPVYSATKAIAAIIPAMLVERGELEYDAPVSALWPEFAAHGKNRLTIAEALSHQSGVPGFVERIDPELWLDQDGLAAAIAAQRPLWPPGTASGYHPLTWGYIAAEITRRASGRTLGAIMREDICAPFDIDFHIGLEDAYLPRVAETKKPSRIPDFGELTEAKRAAFLQPWSSPPRDDSRWLKIEMPSANGCGNARSLARLYAFYASGGVIEGEHIVSPATFRQLTQIRRDGPDLILPFRFDWRAGLLGNAHGFFGPNPNALGHPGAGGSCGFADPDLNMSVGFAINRHAHFLIGDPRALRMIDALYQCVRT